MTDDALPEPDVAGDIEQDHDIKPVSPLRSGALLDRVAELEEERRFLLRSLDDLEREYEAGDVDDADYETLKDGYTVRTAAVIRQIESGQSRLATKGPRRWGRTVAVVAAMTAVAVGMGFVLASAFGERSAGQELSGLDPNDSRSMLATARSTMNGGNFVAANGQFARAVELDRENNIDNVEGITYFGWTLALIANQESVNGLAAEQVERRLGQARLALQQAVVLDPTYADPNCFLAIVEFNFFEDADAALPYIDVCETSNPPADMALLIEGFAADIRAAATG